VKERRVRVLVTGVGGGSIGEQVCKALRLGRRAYHLVAANADPARARVGLPDQVEALPPARDAGYLDAVLALVARHGIGFVAPGSEVELVALAPERARLAAAGAVLLANDERVIRDCVDKVRTFQVLAGAGFRLPYSRELDGPEALAGLELPGPFPWVLKPARGGGGSAGTFIAQDAEELGFFARFLFRGGEPVLLQEYLGRADQEYTVGVLAAPDGALLGSVALRRDILSTLSNRIRVDNRTGRPELGPVLAISSGCSQGVVDDFPAVRRTAEAISAALGSTGPLNVQGRWHEDGFVPFEVNPRFSGTTPMRAMAGFNEPELLIDWHLGEHPGASAPVEVAAGSFTRGLAEFFSPAGHGVSSLPG
jgi:carbamoyl-phosphate synthase large subunit